MLLMHKRKTIDKEVSSSKFLFKKLVPLYLKAFHITFTDHGSILSVKLAEHLAKINLTLNPSQMAMLSYM